MSKLVVPQPNSPSVIPQQGFAAVTEAPGDISDLVEGRSHTVRFGLIALLIGFGGFILWAGFAPLDEGVPSQGTVVIDTKKKAVQHLTGGLVKEVLVGEGDRVKEGQLLIRLDEALARSNYEVARQNYIALRATEGRLTAERRGDTKIALNSGISGMDDVAQVQQLVEAQQQLLESRQSALAAELQSIEESMQGQLAQIQAYEAMRANKKDHLASLAEELSNTRGLVKEGYAPRNRQLELERQEGDIQASISELLGNTTRVKRGVAELKQRMIQRRQEYRKEVDTQLSDVQREIPGAAERLRVAKDDLGRIEIKSPAAGQVVGLAFQSAGAVVSPGQKIMDIVPEGQSLLVEAHVAPHLIDKVRQGLAVDVRFSSFSNSPQLVVDGTVASVSSDLITDQPGTAGYYLARITVTPQGFEKLGKRQLQAGMPVEVIFVTGQRSLLTYLLSPLTKRIAASMKEE